MAQAHYQAKAGREIEFFLNLMIFASLWTLVAQIDPN